MPLPSFKRYSKEDIHFLPSKDNPENLEPGDVIRSNYNNQNRTLLVTASDRGPDGHFMSTRNNMLLNVVEIKENSPSFNLILNIFYKKSNRCHYKYLPKFLKFIFGVSAFKTFKISDMNNIEILNLDEKGKKDRKGKIKDGASFMNIILSGKDAAYKARDKLKGFLNNITKK